MVVIPSVAAPADLDIARISVEKAVEGDDQGSTPSFRPGETVTYVITVSCALIDSPGCVDGAMTDVLPAPLEIDGPDDVTVTNNAGDVSVTGRTVRVDFTSNLGEGYTGLGANEVIIRIKARVAADADPSFDNATITNTAVATAINAEEATDPADIVLAVEENLAATPDKSVASPASGIVPARPGLPVVWRLQGTNSSNTAVDALTLTDASTATPSVFDHLAVTGVKKIDLPQGATGATFTWNLAGGGTTTTTYAAGGSLDGLVPAGVDPSGFAVEFTGPAGAIAKGATGGVDLATVTRDSVADVPEGDSLVLENWLSATVRKDGTTSPAKTDDATVTVKKQNPGVDLTKSFSRDWLTSAGQAVATLDAKVTGMAATSLTLTEPSASSGQPTFGDQGLTFGGYADTDTASITWPAGAESATVVYTYADGSTSSATTNVDGTLPGPDAGKVVARFTATFEGDLQPGAQAVVPFVVEASPEIFAESTATNVATAQATDGDARGETVTSTDAIDLLPERIATELVKEILRPELWGVGGVSTGVKFDAKVSEQPASTIGADSLVITDPVGAGSTFWNYARVTGVTTAEVPANAELVVRYLDADGVWQVLGTYPGPQIVKDLAVPAAPAPGAQGIQLDYQAKPGQILEPGFHVRPVIATELLATGRDGVPLADAYPVVDGEKAPLALANLAGVTVTNDDAVVPVVSEQDDAGTEVLPVDGTGPDLVDKTWAKTYTALAGGSETAQLRWTTAGLPLEKLVLTDPADASALTDLTTSAYDAVDLTQVAGLAPASNGGNRLARLELFSMTTGTWIDVTSKVTGDVYLLDAAEQASTVGVRATFVGPEGRPMVEPETGRYALDLTLRVRDTLRADPATYVLGDDHPDATYNGGHATLRNTVSATGTAGTTDFTSTDADTAVIVDSVLNASISKEFDQSELPIPAASTGADQYPLVDATITVTNTTLSRTSSLEIVDPYSGPGVQVPSNTNTYLRLYGIGEMTVPSGATSTTVTLQRETGPDESYTIAEAQALTPAQLRDVTLVTVTHEGVIAPSAGSTTRLVHQLRDDVALAPGTTITNNAYFELERPGGVASVDSTSGSDDDTLGLANPSYDVTSGKTVTPSTAVEGSAAATGPYTVHLEGRPAGTARTTTLTLTDADPQFFNVFDLTGARLTVPTGGPNRYVVSTLVDNDGDKDLAWSSTGGVVTVTCNGDADLDPCWVDSDVRLASTAVTPPAGVSWSQVRGVRLEVFKVASETDLGDTARVRWERPASPRIELDLTAVRRAALLTGETPSTTRPDVPAAPGEAKRGVTSNSFVVHGEGVWNGQRYSDDAGDDAETTLTHLTNSVKVTKTPGNGKAGDTDAQTVNLGTDIKYGMTVQNTGQWPMTGLVLRDDVQVVGGSSILTAVPAPDTEGTDPADWKVFEFSLADAGGASLPVPAGFSGALDEVTGKVTFTVPAGFILQPGQTLKVVGHLRLRDGAAADKAYSNTFGVRSDRMFDSCAHTTNGVGSTTVTNTDECAATTHVRTPAVAPIQITKAVRGDGAGETSSSADLGVFARTGAAADCAAPNAGGLFYQHPCVPVTRPGGVEEWRMSMKNIGNVDAHVVTIIDTLPRVGDTGVWIDQQRGSAFDVTLLPGVTVDAPSGNTPASTEVYWTSKTLAPSCSDDDIKHTNGGPLVATCKTEVEGRGWTLMTGSETEDQLRTASAIKVVVRWTSNTTVHSGLKPGETVSVRMKTRTPAIAPPSELDLPIAFNSVAGGTGARATANGTLRVSTVIEPRKVGVATAPGAIDVAKIVRTPSAGDGTSLWRPGATAALPTSYTFRLACFAPGVGGAKLALKRDTVTPGVSAWIREDEDDLVVTVPAGGSRVLDATTTNLPLFAECTVTEEGQPAGVKVSYAPGGTTPGTLTALASLASNAAVHHPWAPATAERPRADVTNTYANSGFTVTKNVDDGGAKDQDGDLLVRDWPYAFTASCTYLGREVLVAGETSFSLEHGQSLTFTQIPVGSECSVTEVSRSNAGQSVAMVTTDAGATVVGTPANGTTRFTVTDHLAQENGPGDATASTTAFTNTFSTGSLSFEKTFTGPGIERWSGSTISLDLVCAIAQPAGLTSPREVYRKTFTYGKTDGGRTSWAGRTISETVDDLPTGATCTLTEPVSAGAHVTTTPANGQVRVGDGTTVSIGVTNDFREGGVRVTKAFAGAAKDLDVLRDADAGYEVRLGCTVGGSPISIPGGSDRTLGSTGSFAATWDLLPTDAVCDVTELSASVGGKTLVAGVDYTAASDGPVTVGSGTDAALTLTNTIVDTSVILTKLVTGGAAAWGAPSYSLTLACTWQGESLPDRTVAVPANGTATVTGVPVGSSCQISEPNAHGATNVTFSPSAATEVPALGQPTLGFTATNEYVATTVTVSKAVGTEASDGTGTPVIGRSFAFSLVCTLDGRSQTLTTTVTDGGSHTFTGLPVGAECTVTETAAGDGSVPAVQVTGATASGSGSTTTFTLPAPGVPATGVTAAFTNTYPVGSVAVTKHVRGAGAAWADDPFTVSMTCTAPVGVGGAQKLVYSGTHTFARAASSTWPSQTWTVGNLLVGATCTVTETATGGANSKIVGSPVAVAAGGTATVDVENTFLQGDVVVTKKLAGDPAELVAAKQGTYIVELVCTRVVDGVTVPVTVPGGARRTIDFATSAVARYAGLPTDADCTLSEVSSTPQAQGTTITNGGQLTVGSTNDVALDVTNSFGTTSVTLAKSVTGAVDSKYVPTDFEVTLTCDWYGDDVSPTAPITVPAGGSVTVGGLPVGSTCSVEETGDHGETAVSYTVTQPGETAPTPITPTDEIAIADAAPFTTFTVTNRYDLSAGFDLSKDVVTGALDAAGAGVAIGRSFTFAIACEFRGVAVTEVVASVTLAHDEVVTVDGMPVGSECTVTEQPPGDASTTSIDVTGGSPTTSGRSATFTVGAGSAQARSVTVDYTNTYPVGAIEVVKDIAGDGGVLPDGTPVWAVGPFELDMVCTLPGAGVGGADLVVWDGSHTFERADADDPWTTADLTWRPENLPVGAECVVTEPARGGANAVAFTAPDGTVTVDDPAAMPATEASATVVVTADLTDPVEVTATNTFTTGDLEVTKSIEGPTAPTLDPALDGTYTVTLVCTRPVDGAQVPVAVPGGATRTFTGTGTTRTVTYEGLPTGATCELSETTSTPTPQTVEYTVGTGTPSPTPPTFEVLEGTATAGITVTNTFLDGSVVARKLVVGDGKGFAPADFSATVSCTWEGASVPLPNGGKVTLPGDGTVVTVGDAPEGSVCTIEEDTTGAGQTDVQVSDPVTLVAGETSTLTVTNTYELTGLSVTKKVDGALAADGTPVTYTTSFAFEASCVFRGTEVLAPADRAFTLAQDGSREIGGVPVGSVCTVTETDAAGATSTTVTQVADEVEGAPVTVATTTLTLERGVDHGVVVTNTLPTGPVTVTKVVDGAGAALWGTGTFQVRLVCTADDVAGGTVHDGLHELSATSPTLTVGHLPAGATCEVSETRTGGADASVVTVGSATVTDATDPGATPASFTVTNTFDVAAVEVTKSVEGEGASSARSAEFVVELVCTREVDGETVDVEVPGGARRTLSRAAGLTTRYADLPAAADCTVTEVETGDADATSVVVVQDGVEREATGTSADVVLTGTDVTVRVVNTFDDDDSRPTEGPDEPTDKPTDEPGLPVTGAQVLGAAGLAALLVLVGLVLVAVRRRNA
ncbi:DUF5979 domain-containing protein [Sanguibacter sp. HDW7]|uniref:DUF5979 domain-containing protein n=1 Tax=Sanguibacter sp. HDW7 TaxID=2714931 RepID=UPI0014085AF9|nr:DUF5979 domain-containing protein [Sanguibacter sp. HDW7]QIK84209.1 isopeptide-forming domain-containing fimbrial protein [Sanguibacter sp. HDW7]